MLIKPSCKAPGLTHKLQLAMRRSKWNCWNFTISSQSDEWYHQYKQQDLMVVRRTQLGQIKYIVNCTE
jgi:hypothetical protein